jgi:hypothetical protein
MPPALIFLAAPFFAFSRIAAVKTGLSMDHSFSIFELPNTRTGIPDPTPSSKRRS